MMKTYLLTWQWLLSAALAIWFLFVHSPPILLKRGAFRRPEFFLHLVGSYVIYLACLHNTLYNPFKAKSRHVFVGQVGLVCGTVGFVLGLASIVTSWNDLEMGFAIGITVGGILQMRLQYKGYVAIQQYKQIKQEIAAKLSSDDVTKKEDGTNDSDGSTKKSSSEPPLEQQLQLLRDRQRALLRTHVGCMITLMVSACGMPAMMRLVAHIGLGSGFAPLFVALGLMVVLRRSHTKSVVALLHLDDNNNTKKKDE